MCPDVAAMLESGAVESTQCLRGEPIVCTHFMYNFLGPCCNSAKSVIKLVVYLLPE